MRHSFLSLVPALALNAAGCGSASPGSSSLAGTWEYADPGTGVVRQRLVIGPDQGFSSTTFDGGGQLQDQTHGSYKLDGHDVIADTTNDKTMQRTRVTLQYYVNDTQLAAPALYPLDAHRAIVGKWRGSLKNEVLDQAGNVQKGDLHTATYELRADKTASDTQDDGKGPPTVSNGTWSDAGGGRYQLAFQDPNGSHMQVVFLMDDAVLGAQVYKRAAAGK